jgi:hypothetical protein
MLLHDYLRAASLAIDRIANIRNMVRGLLLIIVNDMGVSR